MMNNLVVLIKVFGEWSRMILPFFLTALGIYLTFCIVYTTAKGDPSAMSKLLNRLLEG